MNKKYTVFVEQHNRTNFQVLAKDEKEAKEKGIKLYKKHLEIPHIEIQDNCLVEEDGEDK